MPNVPTFWIDAFASTPYSGNPAVICALQSWAPTPALQKVAAEFNVSETAFLVLQGRDYAIRWLTPSTEVDLVGHATLAAAHAVMNHLEPGRQEVRFLSERNGALTARRQAGQIALDLPALAIEPAPTSAALVAGLGVRPVETFVGKHYLAALENEDQVRALSPDHASLLKLDRPAVMVTAPGRACDYVLRFFAPANGVPEDPVSGVAQCMLVPYWARRLGKASFEVRQLSPRGGQMRCALKDKTVTIGGPCVTVLAGMIEINATA